jgi:nicotinate dehydrogenase subunit B
MNKNDKYLNLDFKDIPDHLPFSRREFLKLSGGGIVIFLSLKDTVLAQERRGGQRGYPTDFNAYLIIGTDGRIKCFTGKIEMGQGIITSLAQMLAEELDVPLESVDMVMGDTDLCPWDMGTFGSMTTRFFGPALRIAGAEAKTVLLELAAEYFKVQTSQLHLKDGMIYNQNGDNVTYAQLTKGKKITRHLSKEVTAEDVAKFTVVGKPVNRSDALEKVSGEAKFAADIFLAEMLYARILRPPAHGAKLIHVDTSEAEKIKDTILVKQDDFIAVLHKYPDEAEKAFTKIKAKFEISEPTVDDKGIFKHLLNAAKESEIVAEGGNLSKGEPLADYVFEETYLNSYVAHAPIEPHAALAKVEGDKVTVWASTQAPFRIKDEVAEELNFSADHVRIITPFVGGGFGGKVPCQPAVEAARLSKITGKPVQVVWTRAEEFFFDTFRPAALVKIKSGTINTGQVIFWDYNVYFAGERGAVHFYTIPHHKTTAYGSGWSGGPGIHPFRTGAWRAPANNTNTFARESQIDIMAAKLSIDPLEFRLKNLKDKRMIRVLHAVAEAFGWKPAPAPSSRGYGIACGTDAGTYVASIAEVEVDEKKAMVMVKRVVCAQDMGLVINPEGAKIQMEGCITMGLGYALSEEIHFKGGNIFDLNFDTYEIPRFSWLPKIETILIDNRESPAQGGGEPAIICMGAVIANAIYDAIGARLFQLPMTPQRIKEAMKKT